VHNILLQDWLAVYVALYFESIRACPWRLSRGAALTKRVDSCCGGDHTAAGQQSTHTHTHTHTHTSC